MKKKSFFVANGSKIVCTLILLMSLLKNGSIPALAAHPPAQGSIPPAVSVYNDKSAFLAALSSPVVVNFDNLSGGTLLTGDEFSSQGLTITHLDGKQINVVSSPPITSNFSS